MHDICMDGQLSLKTHLAKLFIFMLSNKVQCQVNCLPGLSQAFGKIAGSTPLAGLERTHGYKNMSASHSWPPVLARHLSNLHLKRSAGHQAAPIEQCPQLVPPIWAKLGALFRTANSGCIDKASAVEEHAHAVGVEGCHLHWP